MIILDTDHLTVLKYARDSRFMKLAERMAEPEGWLRATAMAMALATMARW